MFMLPAVSAAKKRLAEGFVELKQLHESGFPGDEMCAKITQFRDAVLLELFEAALTDLGGGEADRLRSEIALVAHGGDGRRDLAPHSDVDLMILHPAALRQQVTPLAKRWLRDVFDAGLLLGHSVRSPEDAIALACKDPVIATSLIESRRLAGNETLFDRFIRGFRRTVCRQPARLIAAIVKARRDERVRYGESVFLLEPNLKRSRGGLREMHLIRWIGLVRYGVSDPVKLRRIQTLTDEDVDCIERANRFLLRVRNEMHFHAGKGVDVIDRAEQIRIAERFGYRADAALTPAERFMQDYFRHTSRISHIADRFVTNAQSRGRLKRLITTVFGHRVEEDLRAGPAGIVATPQGLQRVRGDLTAVVRMADLANLYNKPIASETWEVVRRHASQFPERPSPEACRHFLSLLSQPARLGSLLSDLRDAGVLVRFIPGFANAHGLLQFNQYHKYTVDEHCLRAVDWVTNLFLDMGPLGRAYRRIGQKHILHLALLIHDLGKGLGEDHCEAGRRIARETAERLGMAPRDAEALEFLVHKHLLMNHLAFRRDTGDEQVVVRFARQIGSPEMLHMLYVLTAADLAAVGPGVWDGWKDLILTDLYHRTVQYLAGDAPATTVDKQIRERRQAVRAALGPDEDDAWFLRQLDAMPTDHLTTSQPEHILADLRMLRAVGPGQTTAEGHYHADVDAVRFTVVTHEQTTPGVFHRLTGALASQGLAIRSADINTLADGLVLDRFVASDPMHAGEPPAERIAQVNAALVESLQGPAGREVSSPRRWRVGAERRTGVPGPKTRVSTDNATSDRSTILDIFAQDRPGLLYTIARALFELDLSVWRAKIGTYGEQVVDVFYVTDPKGRKIEDTARLDEITRRLVEVIEAGRPE